MVADPRAVEYIRSQLDAGFTIETIERAMLDAGWKEQQVEEAIDRVMEEGHDKEDDMMPAGRPFPTPGKPLVSPQSHAPPLPPAFPGPQGPPAQQPALPVPQRPQKQMLKPGLQKEEGGVPILYVLGVGLALAGGAAVLNETLASVMPDMFILIADSFSPASFSTLLGDPATAGIVNMLFGLVVVVMAALLAFMRDFRMFLAPAILVLSVMLLLNGFFIGSLLGMVGAVLELLSR